MVLIAVVGTTVAIGGFVVARAISKRRRKCLPRARRSDHVDEYFGETVADPYRWMEDPDSPETKAWVKAQVQHTEAYVHSDLEPIRGNFQKRLQDVYSYDKFGAPWRVGDYWFFFKHAGLEHHSVLYKQKRLDEEPEVLLDPNKLSDAGTSSLHGYDVSKDGKKLLYGISRNGSDWFTVYVRDVVTGEDLNDEVEWCKFGSMTWEESGKGFFYASFPRPKKLEGTGKSAGTEVEVAKGHRVMYHRLGTDSSEDELVYQSPMDKNWLASPIVTDDWKTLLISIGDSCDPVNRLFYCDLSGFDGENVSTMAKMVKLVDNFDSLYSYITNDGRTFWFRTNMDAPKYKVVKMQLPPSGSPMEWDEPALAAIPKTTIVPEDETGVLQEVSVVAGDWLVLTFERDACNQLELCDLAGEHKKAIDVPGIGTIGRIAAHKEYDHIFFKFTNFVTPGLIYRGSIEKATAVDGAAIAADSTTVTDKSATVDASVKLEVFRNTQVPGICLEDFETKQVRYASKDGTVVPMFVVGQKGAERPGPCMLYGYGGFNISLRPQFSASQLLFIQHFGGRVCVANIRGGGEYGEDWHQAGTIHKKQNVFDDFTAAARYLTKESYTTKEQLAIMGGSNGGLLVGACINQHPELFAAAVAQVGVMDMLRFDQFTIGYAWRSDFGSAEANEEQFKTLRAYSPVHNVNQDAGPYPAVLLTTGDHDDRVCPLHSYKYMAELQYSIGSREDRKPLVIRIDVDCGHCTGKPTEKIIAEASDIYAFIAKHTGATWRS